MKVLYFHQHFTTPALGGGTRSYELSQELIKHGHKVTMVCGKSSKLVLPETRKKGVFRGDVDGIDVIQLDLPYSNHDGFMKRSWVFLKFGWASVRVALKEEYDLLFATSTPLTAGIPGVVMKIFRRKPFVFEVRDLWPELPKALGLKNPILLWGMSLLEWASYKAADSCIGLSPGICEGIAKRSKKGKPIDMVPNGCDLDIFKPGKRSELQLEGIMPSDIVSVFTGAHGMANGLDAVLDAAAELKKRNRNDIILAFIGDGKLKPKLIERAKAEGLDNCRFYDPMPKTKLNAVVSNSDIGLMILANIPAFYYGTSPNKFFDYISSGLPVLNNYPGWLADMINQHQCGEAVPPADATVFADALVKLADNPDLRKTYGINGRKLAESEFAREKLAKKWINCLEATLERYKLKYK